MTENQAIKILKEEKSWESDDRKIDAFIMGIEALYEIQQYRAIGTVDEVAEMSNSYINYFHKVRQFEAIGTIEEFEALKEKNTPKKPFGGMYDWTCPTCGTYHSTHGKCCSECMQMILWD